MLKTSSTSDIALAIPDFAGGGAERAALNLARALGDLGVRVRFLVERSEGVLAAEAKTIAPVDVLEGDSIASNVLALRRRMREQRSTTFISFMTRSNILCSLARVLLPRKPVLILTEHNNRRHLLRQMKPHKRALTYTALMFSFQNADKVVCVSDGILEITRTLFAAPARKFVRIYNPIVTKQTACVAVDKKPQRRSGALIVSAGRLHPQKDFPTLIRAAAKLRPELAFRMQIFGEGPERERLEALVRLIGVEDVVSFPGFEKDLLSKIRQADLFVLSSRWEGFGNVLAEALACGTPVVSTDCESGPREILDGGRYGLLAPVGDAKRLASAILQALSAPRKVPPTAALRFNADTVAKEYLATINDLKNPRSLQAEDPRA